MRTTWIKPLLFATALLATGARAQEARLALTQEDIPRVKAFAAGLKQAAAAGPKQAKAFLAGPKAKGTADARQQLLNVSIAYTALALEDELAQLEALGAGKDAGSEYGQRVAQTRKELEDLTAEHRRAKTKDGRTALEVNQEIVKRNLPAVEQLIRDVRATPADSLPN